MMHAGIVGVDFIVGREVPYFEEGLVGYGFEVIWGNRPNCIGVVNWRDAPWHFKFRIFTAKVSAALTLDSVILVTPDCVPNRMDELRHSSAVNVRYQKTTVMAFGFHRLGHLFTWDNDELFRRTEERI